MKHRFSFAVAYLCVLALFALGVWELVFAPKESTLSAAENRMLQGFPEASVKSVADAEGWSGRRTSCR